MIDWYKKCQELHRVLIAVTIRLIIVLILFILRFRGITSTMNKKNEEINKQQIEIDSLKETIHILESRGVNNE